MSNLAEQIPIENNLPAYLRKNGVNGNNSIMQPGALSAAIEKRRTGRQSSYTPEKAAEVIMLMENGATLTAAAEAIGHSREVVWTWGKLFPDFFDAIAAAREAQGHSMADDAVNIVDNAELDPNDPKHTAMVLRKAEIRSRTRIRLAESYAPKTYSPKSMNQNLNINVTVDPVDLSRFVD